jgi:hypothetical protein
MGIVYFKRYRMEVDLDQPLFAPGAFVGSWMPMCFPHWGRARAAAG